MVMKRTLTLPLFFAGILAAGCGPGGPHREALDQYASGVATSSGYAPGANPNDYKDIQAIGAPNHDYGAGGHDCSDDPVAWAPAEDNSAVDQYIQVTFDRYVYISTVKIFESFNPGAIYEVDAIATDGSTPDAVMYHNPAGDGPATCGSFSIDVNAGTTQDQYNSIMVHIDSTLTNNGAGDYNEIDAVQMSGDQLVQ